MVEMLLQEYITTARELNVHIVTEQNGISLVPMNYKCCYLTCKKLLHFHTVPNLYLIMCVNVSLTTNLPEDFGLLYL